MEHRLLSAGDAFHTNTDLFVFAFPIVFGSAPTLNFVCDEVVFDEIVFWMKVSVDEIFWMKVYSTVCGVQV